MNRLTKSAFYLAVCIVLALSFFHLESSQAAGTANLSVSPASGSVVNGSNITINVYENSGSEGVNAVQANLSYSTAQLAYVSYSSSSAFNIEAENPSSNSGSLHFGRGSITPRTGNQLVVSVTFKAVAGSGNATVSFGSGSSVNASDGTGTNILSGSSSGTFTLAAATTASPPAQTQQSPSSSSSSNKKTASNSPAPAPSSGAADKAPPEISSVKVSSLSPDQVVVTWKTSEPATSVVMYGPDAEHLITASDTALVTDHRMVLGGGVLGANTQYHIIVKSTDAAGNSAENQDSTFKTGAAQPSAGTEQENGFLDKPEQIAAVAVAIVMLLLLAAGLRIRQIRRGHQKDEIARHVANPQALSTGTDKPEQIIKPNPPSAGKP